MISSVFLPFNFTEVKPVYVVLLSITRALMGSDKCLQDAFVFELLIKSLEYD